jgi:hypothetical protein
MNKNWWLTAAFGAVLAVLCAVYFLSSPPATTTREEQDIHVLAGLTADKVTKIEVSRKDGGALTFETAKDQLGDHWIIVEQGRHTAESALVQQLLFSLDRLVKTGALEPGRPETAPELTGLAEPSLTVTFTAGARRDVLRFGKQPPTNTKAVFYQHEGDPKIYLVGVETYDAFTKPALQYRAKTLVRFAPHKVHKVVLEFKFLRPQGKGKPDLVEYEKSVLERFEEGAERGWYLTHPHRERLYDHSVASLVTRLADLQGGDYQPIGEPKEKGLEEPQVRVGLYSLGEEKPVEIHFGALAERGKRRWVWSPGSAEAALYDSNHYDEIPLQRSMLRVRQIFPFSAELVKRLEIEAKDLGKVVLERKEQKKDGESVATTKWEMIEPTGMKVEAERLEAFVAAIVVQEITGFLGAQDPKLAGLDPAPLRMEILTKEGKKHLCWFSLSAQGFLLKDGVDEIFEVRPELVKMLQRLELNFVSMEMFSVPRASIREIAFDRNISSDLKPVNYRLKLNPATQTWAFTDTVHKNAKVDPERVDNLLTQLNYLKAESLISRDPRTIEKHRLDPTTAPSILRIAYEIGEGKDAKPGDMELYLSEDQSNKPGTHVYYARLRDNLAIFQINTALVEYLQQAPELKADPDKPK